MSAFIRENLAVFDDFGPDPLRDNGLNAVQNVSTFLNHIVTYQQAARPELISFEAYQTVNLWWAIMAYNGITEVREIVEGSAIKIPDYAELVAALSAEKYVPSLDTSDPVTI
jgi:hypothetical protein